MSTLTRTPNYLATLLAPPLAAVQFLTRIPVPAFPFDERTLPRAAAWFPLVGTALGLAAALTQRLLTPHLPRSIVAIAVVALLVVLTGALHEDALADCADAFGLPRARERTLAILHDSAIGSFGAAALSLALFVRIALIAALPLTSVTSTLIAALTLGRWSVLPLSLLASATPAGRGGSIARKVTTPTHVLGTLFTVAVLAFTLHRSAILPCVAALLVIALTAVFYHRRLGGTTGDCFGATIQLVEITVLLCGVWHA
jgi:adenosylcobinamide-GDP ribazoletransferase